MKRISFSAVLCILFFANSGNAQDISHVFPQIADGTFADGSYYKSSFRILPWSDTEAPTCSLRLYGLGIALGAAQSSTHDITIPAGGFYAVTSGGNQAFKSGYATLSCSSYVFAEVLYTFYSAGGAKLSEATVFSSQEILRSRLILDQREGSRLGLAISNNTDLEHSYEFSIGTSKATIRIPARTSVARFVDEVMTGVPNLGILKVESVDSSDFAAIGLRFTGNAFTTIPSNY